jgi:hypothetical protein
LNVVSWEKVECRKLGGGGDKKTRDFEGSRVCMCYVDETFFYIKSATEAAGFAGALSPRVKPA